MKPLAHDELESQDMEGVFPPPGSSPPPPVAVPILLQELREKLDADQQLEQENAAAEEELASPTSSSSSSSSSSSLRKKRSEELQPLRAELQEVASKGSVEERILAKLIDDEFDVIIHLEETKRQLAYQSLELVLQGNLQGAKLVGQVLRGALGSSNMLKRRIQNCAAALVNLRLQRHVLVLAHEASDDGD